ncbi:hypothetical protein MTO96_024366 [Rhipicephalus appendiculatus]
MASRGPAFATENSSARLLTSREQRTEERMDFSDSQTRSTPTTTGTVGADADSICRTHTTTNASEDDDEGWRTVLTLRQKSSRRGNANKRRGTTLPTQAQKSQTFPADPENSGNYRRCRATTSK